jgi:hypothetical protein
VAGCCEHGNKPLGYISGGDFLNIQVTVRFIRNTLFHGVSNSLLTLAYQTDKPYAFHIE